MTTRLLACALLLGFASAHAAPAKKQAPPPPEEIDVDAMARAKDVGAKPAESTATTTEASDAALPVDAPPPVDAVPPVDATAPPKEAGADTEGTDPAAAGKDAAAQAEASAASPAPVPAGSQDALALTPPIDPTEKRLGMACEARSTNLLDAAQKGDFAAATKDFDAKMRSALPPEKFKETWASLAQFGPLKARGQAHPSKGEGYFIVMTPLIFEQTNLVAQIACGSDGRIAGFHVKPLAALQH